MISKNVQGRLPSTSLSLKRLAAALEVLETAILVESETIAQPAHNILVADAESREYSPYDLLEAGERLRDRKLPRFAYYHITIMVRQVWSIEHRLNKGHIHNLTTGAINCIEKWDEFKRI